MRLVWEFRRDTRSVRDMQIGAQLSRKNTKGCGFDFAVPEWHKDIYSKIFWIFHCSLFCKSKIQAIWDFVHGTTGQGICEGGGK